MNSDLEQLEIKEVNRKIGELLEQAVFTDMQEKIVRMRYGFEGIKPANFTEITKVLNVKKSDLIKEIYKIDKKIFNYLKNEV
jgi:DNA-directed RNA polymerase sigma subunit (sigma70/sigma32)